MRRAILLLCVLPSALSIAACTNSARPAKLGDHPPVADLEPRSCPPEPVEPTDDDFVRDPLAPQRFELELVKWGRCNVDARVRVCDWHLERTSAGDLTCSLPKRPE